MQSEHRGGIWHRRMHHSNHEKPETTHSGRNSTTKSRQNKNALKNGKLQILGNIWIEHHYRDERKNSKRIPHENKKTNRNQTLQKKSHQRDKHLGYLFLRYLWPLLKWTREELQQMDTKTRKLITMYTALYPSVKKRRRNRICVRWRERRFIDTATRGLHKKSAEEDGLQRPETIPTNRRKITQRQKWEEKLCRYFKQQTSKIPRKKIWTQLRKGKHKRWTETLLIAEQNNNIKTNYVNVNIDKTQQNSKSSLCCDRDKMINHIISERGKLGQKTIRLVRNVIHRELGKKQNFDHTNKWYIHTGIHPGE